MNNINRTIDSTVWEVLSSQCPRPLEYTNRKITSFWITYYTKLDRAVSQPLKSQILNEITWKM